MSLENNRKDFEDVLKRIENTTVEMDERVPPALVDLILRMVDEYNIHYSDDIDRVLDDNEHLYEDLDVTEKRVCELLEELDASKENACGLWEDISNLRIEVIELKTELLRKISNEV